MNSDSEDDHEPWNNSGSYFTVLNVSRANCCFKKIHDFNDQNRIYY